MKQLKIYFFINNNLKKKINKINEFKIKKNNIKKNNDFYKNNIIKMKQNLSLNNKKLKHNINFFSNNLHNSFYDSRFTSFLSYLSIIELINYKNFKNKFDLKYKYSLFNIFTAFLIKDGKSLFTNIESIKAISGIYNILIEKNNNNFIGYKFIDQFKLFLQKNIRNLNVNYIFSWIIELYNPIFDLKCYKEPRIIKKKKKRNLFKYIYILEKNRLRTTFKHINLIIKINNKISLEKRIENVFLDTCLNYTKSYLYTRKLFIYKRLMKL